MARLLEKLDGGAERGEDAGWRAREWEWRRLTIDPGSTDAQNGYKLLIGVIVPRPIAFVSSVSGDGVLNLAPFSFFTAASANPPVICFCPMVSGQGSHKDTLNNIRATGEFVVNIVSEEIAERMNITSGTYPPEVASQ